VVRCGHDKYRATIQPIITRTIAPGSLIYTDEYDIYRRLEAWGYQHKSVNHGAGEYARDEDGDGFCEVHVNALEGLWSLLRSWLRPHRGISQEKLPWYLGFFEFIHNVRRRGKALLHSLLATKVVGRELRHALPLRQTFMALFLYTLVYYSRYDGDIGRDGPPGISSGKIALS
jgi:transposase